MLTVASLAANAAKLDLVALEILGVLGVRVAEVEGKLVAEVEGELVRDFNSLDLTTTGLLLLVLGVCKHECVLSGMFFVVHDFFLYIPTHTFM